MTPQHCTVNALDSNAQENTDFQFIFDNIGDMS